MKLQLNKRITVTLPEEQTFETNEMCAALTIKDCGSGLLELHFGIDEPESQCIGAADARELATLFAELATFLEDSEIDAGIAEIDALLGDDEDDSPGCQCSFCRN